LDLAACGHVVHPSTINCWEVKLYMLLAVYCSKYNRYKSEDRKTEKETWLDSVMALS
jgi:hypothetical protein